MQFRKPEKKKIAAGELTKSVRRWARPQVKIGGQYNIHPFGAIEVTRVRTRKGNRLTRPLARACGFADVAALAEQLGQPGPEDVLYEVDFRYLGAAKVNQPDRAAVTSDEAAALSARIRQMDARSKRGPWAAAALAMIGDAPGTRAADLAKRLGWETQPFKANVRRLKALGLTESLEVGYRLTTRGEQVRKTL